MARGEKHDDATRAAVIGALILGQNVTEIAAEYKLPESTIHNWKRTLDPNKLAEVKVKQGEVLDDLIYQSLTAGLLAMSKIAHAVSDPEYIRKNRADSIAVLYGVMADKQIRLLEASCIGASAADSTEADSPVS